LTSAAGAVEISILRDVLNRFATICNRTN